MKTISEPTLKRFIVPTFRAPFKFEVKNNTLFRQGCITVGG